MLTGYSDLGITNLSCVHLTISEEWRAYLPSKSFSWRSSQAILWGSDMNQIRATLSSCYRGNDCSDNGQRLRLPGTWNSSNNIFIRSRRNHPWNQIESGSKSKELIYCKFPHLPLKQPSTLTLPFVEMYGLKSRTTSRACTDTLTRRLAVVHLWPAVPTAAKRADGTTKLRSASSKA